MWRIGLFLFIPLALFAETAVVYNPFTHQLQLIRWVTGETGAAGDIIHTGSVVDGNLAVWDGAAGNQLKDGGVRAQALVFDGSTANPGDGSTLSWSDGGSYYETTYTVPAGRTWIIVDLWAGGGGGSGSISGTRGGGGGSGGGYAQTICKTVAGATITIRVGKGGAAGLAAAQGGAAGDSSIAGCLKGDVTVYGAGIGGVNVANAGLPGSMFPLSHTLRIGPMGNSTTGASFTIPNIAYCTAGASGGMPGHYSVREDQGACGGGAATGTGNPGGEGGRAIAAGGGGGAGGFGANAVAAAAGTSVYGGAGGTGGAGNGSAECTPGVAPGGGGGGGHAEAGAGTDHAGCAGARGEVRLYW